MPVFELLIPCNGRAKGEAEYMLLFGDRAVVLRSIMIWKNCVSNFYLLSFLGALRGLAPVEGGAEKPQALERGGRLPLLLL